MERRSKLLGHKGVRNMEQYNKLFDDKGTRTLFARTACVILIIIKTLMMLDSGQIGESASPGWPRWRGRLALAWCWRHRRPQVVDVITPREVQGQLSCPVLRQLAHHS